MDKDGAKQDGVSVAAGESYADEKPQRPSTLSLTEADTQDDDTMLRIWQDKLKRRHASTDIDTALADIAKTGDEIQQLARPMSHRSSRLPVTQPAPVVAVTNTVLSPVMQESRPRETTPIWPERAVPCRERHRSMIDPSQVREAMRLASNPPNQVLQTSAVIVDPTIDADRLPILRVTSPDHEEHKIVDRIVDVDQKDGPLSAIGYQEKIPGSVKSSAAKSQVIAVEEKIPSPNKQQHQQQQQSSSLFKSRFIPDISITSTPTMLGKARELEMNDEGFEETQSLVSESLSQETSSGNYETDNHDSPRCSPAAELRYRGPEKPEVIERRRTVGKDEIARLKAFGPRAGSMRLSSEKSSFLPKRTGSLKREEPRKVDSTKRAAPIATSGSGRHEVERSGSRSSLRSSRSSLNSATSVNTVRKLAPSHARLGSYTSAICAMTSDLRKSPAHSPLPAVPKDNEKRRSAPRTNSSRIPASRSSSSGSSVGPVAKNIRKVAAVSI